MGKYIQYDIENLEEIKIATTVNQSDTQFSRSFISGSNVRGAFISEYIKSKKIEDLNKDESRKLLLMGGLKFLNAYPIEYEERSVPFPNCYYGLKDDIKEGNMPLNIVRFSEVIKLKEKDEEKNYTKIKGKEFGVLINSDDLGEVKVSKKEYLHIRKPKLRDEDNKLFRYEVIESNTKFRGYIKVEDEYEDSITDIKDILTKSDFYIGGSKGSGYGLCKIYNMKIVEDNPELSYFENKVLEEDCYDDEDKIYIYALSDIIYRDKLGVYKTIFDEEYIAEKIGATSVSVNEETSVVTDYFTSFNKKWGYRSPIINGIKMGSVISYDITDGEIDADKVIKFMDEGIGERKSDGYGRFIVLTSLQFKKIVEVSETKEHFKLKELDKKKSNDMEVILNRIYKAKIDNKIPQIVIELQDVINNIKAISDSQWGKLFNLMGLLLDKNRKDGIRRVQEYFKHINEKQRNRDLADALKKIKINGENLEYFIEKRLNMNVENFESIYCNSIELGNIKSSISEEEVYNYNVKILRELFRLNLRKKGVK